MGRNYSRVITGRARRRLPGLALASVLGAAPVLRSQDLPPIRPIGSIVATTRQPIGGTTTVRQLSDGRLLVNDAVGRRVLLFDASLARVTVLIDSAAGTAKRAYGAPAYRPMIAHVGDTTLLLDPASLAFLVIDPDGQIAAWCTSPSARQPVSPWSGSGFDEAPVTEAAEG